LLFFNMHCLFAAFLNMHWLFAGFLNMHWISVGFLNMYWAKNHFWWNAIKCSKVLLKLYFILYFNDLVNHLTKKKCIMNFQMVTTLIAILITWYIGQTSKDAHCILDIRWLSKHVLVICCFLTCIAYSLPF
jgi:hypothetical protein